MKTLIKIILSTISPKITMYLVYFLNFGEFPNLKKPISINEKLQYLKFNDYYHNDIITQCVDKYRVREYLCKKNFSYLLPELYLGGVYANDIFEKWESLPKSMVIKCNHGCGYNILIKDKDLVNKYKIKKQLNKWLKEDSWKIYGEPQYKYVEKCVLVEQYLGDNIDNYKFFCFHGVPKFLYVSCYDQNGREGLYIDYYDIDFNRINVSLSRSEHKINPIKKPNNYNEMVSIAKELSQDFPFVRIDLYNVGGKIYFSEFTFIPTGGYMKVEPSSYLYEWGGML